MERELEITGIPTASNCELSLEELYNENKTREIEIKIVEDVYSSR